MIREVVKYHIDNYQASIDPVWWGCRYSDMKVYAMQIKREKHKSGGCMSMEYPFDVWSFVTIYSRKDFIRQVLRQLLEHWRGICPDDSLFLNYIEATFRPELIETVTQLELF